MTNLPSQVGASTGTITTLEHECRVFARYLAGVEITDYVARKYAEAHDRLPSLAARGRFDDLLLGLARGPGFLRWPAAAFARVHAPDSALQNRLVTLLAILESAPETSRTIDSVPSTNRALLLIRLGLRGALAVLALIAGTIVLTPLRWWTRSARPTSA